MGLNEAFITPTFLLPSPLRLKRGAEKPPGRPQPLIQCAHMVGSSKEETSSSPGAVRVLELSSCSLLSYITRRICRGRRERESKANERKLRNVIEDVLLMYRLLDDRAGESQPSPQAWLPSQSSLSHGWSWVR